MLDKIVDHGGHGEERKPVRVNASICRLRAFAGKRYGWFPRVPRGSKAVFLMIGALLAAAPLLAAGEALPDPTRPAIGAEAGASVAAEGASGPRLQMIKISPTRRSAIVDGQEVTVGSRVGDMRVTKILEGEVVLRGTADTETLKLFTDVDKRPIAAPKHPGKTPGAKTHRSTGKKTDAKASRKARQ